MVMEDHRFRRDDGEVRVGMVINVAAREKIFEALYCEREIMDRTTMKVGEIFQWIETDQSLIEESMITHGDLTPGETLPRYAWGTIQNECHRMVQNGVLKAITKGGGKDGKPTVVGLIEDDVAPSLTPSIPATSPAPSECAQPATDTEPLVDHDADDDSSNDEALIAAPFLDAMASAAHGLAVALSEHRIKQAMATIASRDQELAQLRTELAHERQARESAEKARESAVEELGRVWATIDALRPQKGGAAPAATFRPRRSQGAPQVLHAG